MGRQADKQGAPERVKFIVHLDPEQYEELRHAAYVLHRSMASIIREALREHLRRLAPGGKEER